MAGFLRRQTTAVRRMLPPGAAEPPPAPVFIIGSYRSATSVTTWVMGQHPNIFPLEETHFIYKLAVDLDYLYEIGSGLGDRSFLGAAELRRGAFYQYFGRACDRLVRDSREPIIHHAASEQFRHTWSDNYQLTRSPSDPKRRWVDGTPENSHFVYPLLRMFPSARFIHILRNPKLVATSLMHFSSVSTAGQADYSEEDAYRLWTGLVRSSCLAEIAFGPQRVLRIDYDDIVRDAEDVVRRCLAFVGEPFDPNCILPFRERINRSTYDGAGDISIETNLQSPKPHVREAFALYQAAIAGRVPGVASPMQAFAELKRSFRQYADSLRPSTNEWLSGQCWRLEQENAALRANVQELQDRLKPTDAPLRIIDFGPRDILLGEAFNRQADGQSALWVETENAGPNAIVELAGEVLDTVVHPDGRLVTACVPNRLLLHAGEFALHLKDPGTGERVGPEIFRILVAPEGPSEPADRSAPSAERQTSPVREPASGRVAHVHVDDIRPAPPRAPGEAAS